MLEPVTMSKGWGERTAADLSSLLVELSRLHKGLTFYAPDHPVRRELIDRAFLAWRVNLERAGPLELYVSGSETRCGDLDESIAGNHQEELLSALASRGVRQLRFEPGMDRDCFQRFAELLSDSPAATTHSSFARALYTQGNEGITVNDVAPPKPDPIPDSLLADLPLPEPTKTEPTKTGPMKTEQPVAQPASHDRVAESAPDEPALARPPQPGPTSAGIAPASRPPAGLSAGQRSHAASPDSQAASLGSALLRGGEPQHTALPDRPDRETDGPQSPTRVGGELPTAQDTQPTEPAEQAAGSSSIEEDPYQARGSDTRGERLRLGLRELDRCSDDTDYETIARRISSWMAELDEATRLDESYRVMLVLADHAAGLGGRSGSQVRIAQATLEELADGALIADLIDRGCTRERSKGVRPAQVLLQLGGIGVPALLERLEVESDRRLSSEISALLIALGEHAVPALARSLSLPPSNGRTQLAIRLAGELQSPKLIPILANILRKGGPALRKEAAKALVHIGNDEATSVLIEALSSPVDDLPHTAALCLGVLGDARSVQPLLAALERAASGRQPRLAEGILRALGTFRDNADLIVPRLTAVLDQKSLVRRRQLRGPKLAALLALESLADSAARLAIVAATNDRDSAVCKRAREILARQK